MCTIIALHRLRDDLPLVVAANRDEFLDRPASGPRLLQRDPPAIGGVDLDKGGTWMAVSATGFFVGLTNQRPTRPQGPAPRSRGALVLEALATGSVDGTQRLLEAADSGAYSAFNLMFGDGHRLLVAYVRPGRTTAFQELEPGVHVLTNDRLGSPHFPKAQRAEQLTQPSLAQPWPELAAGLERVLADHHLPDRERLSPPPPGLPLPPEVARRLQALCIHLPRYGTRSATILALEPGRLLHYRYAEGKPCEAEFEDRMELLEGAPRYTSSSTNST
jgi:uncharacterized protein with NRDE domain